MTSVEWGALFCLPQRPLADSRWTDSLGRLSSHWGRHPAVKGSQSSWGPSLCAPDPPPQCTLYAAPEVVSASLLTRYFSLKPNVGSCMSHSLPFILLVKIAREIDPWWEWEAVFADSCEKLRTYTDSFVSHLYLWCLLFFNLEKKNCFVELPLQGLFPDFVGVST